MNRMFEMSRKTKETDISLSMNIDGTGKGDIDTGVGFFDHMLNLFARHGLFDLVIKAKGDLEVDSHHTVEDVGIVLGQVVKEALGEKESIKRYGSSFVPMDEALAVVAVDIGGRPYSVIEVTFNETNIGDMDADLVRHFLVSFASEARINLHAKVLSGINDHHKAEALFKALGRALDSATQVDERILGRVPSTKEVIEG